jgi:hypothetical protein
MFRLYATNLIGWHVIAARLQLPPMFSQINPNSVHIIGYIKARHMDMVVVANRDIGERISG